MSKLDIDHTTHRVGRGIPVRSLVSQGTIPAADAIRILADQLNLCVAGIGQCIFSHSSDLQRVSNFTVATGTAASYGARFKSSQNCRQLFVCAVVVPAPDSGTSSDASVDLVLKTGFASAQSTVASRSFYVAGRVLAAGQSADNMFTLSSVWDVDGSTLYEMETTLTNEAGLVSLTIHELLPGRGKGLDTADYDLVNPALISAHSPILTTTLEELLDVADVARREPKMLAYFCPEGIDGAGVGSTARNVFGDETKTTAAGDDSPGFYIDLTGEEALSSGANGATSDGTAVPVVFCADLEINSGTGGTVELRTQADVVVATISTAGGTALVGHTASGVLSTTDTKLCVFAQSGALGNVYSRTISVWRQHLTDPRDIPDLLAWYDATDLLATLSYTDDVATWPDKSGNGYDLTASGAGDPTFENAGAQNACVRVAGTNYLANANFAEPTDVTVFLVLKAPTSLPASNKPYVISLDSAASSRWGYQQRTTDAAGAIINGASAAHGSALTWTNIAIHSWQSEANHFGFNTTCHTNSADNVDITYAVGATEFRIGSNAAGDYHDVLIYGRALTVSEVHAVEHYLAVKWGVSTN
jgi:hypothetical protein